MARHKNPELPNHQYIVRFSCPICGGHELVVQITQIKPILEAFTLSFDGGKIYLSEKRYTEENYIYKCRSCGSYTGNHNQTVEWLLDNKMLEIKEG